MVWLLWLGRCITIAGELINLSYRRVTQAQKQGSGVFKTSLRISAAVALAAIMGLVASLYLPATSDLGKQVVGFLGGDAIVHAIVCFVLPLCLAFLARLYWASKRLQWAYWLACLTVFAADELLQGLSPLRESDPTDFMMSTLGWLIGPLWQDSCHYLKFNQFGR